MPKSADAETGPYRLGASPSHLLHRAEQLATERFTHLVGDPITLRQFAVLAAIAEAPGLSQADLVRVTGIDRSTLAEMITRMERQKWIDRSKAVNDARAVSVRLTPLGSQNLAAATPHARAADAAILDLLPRTKRRAFLNTLIKLAKLSDQAAAKAERNARRQSKRAGRQR